MQDRPRRSLRLFFLSFDSLHATEVRAPIRSPDPKRGTTPIAPPFREPISESIRTPTRNTHPRRSRRPRAQSIGASIGADLETRIFLDRSSSFRLKQTNK